MVDLTNQFPNLTTIEVQKAGYCGVACLADCVRKLNGVDISQDEIAELLQVDPNEGTSHTKMVEGPKHYGLTVQEIQNPDLSLTELAKELDRPNTKIILNIMLERDMEEGGTHEDEREGGHYVVFEGLAKIADQVFAIYNDPSFPSAISLVKIEVAEKKWYDFVPQQNYERIAHWAIVLTKPE